MTKEEFLTLIEKYLSGNANSAEQKLVDDFFDAQQIKHATEHYSLSDEMWSSIEGRIKERIHTPSYSEQTAKRSHIFSNTKVLVSLIILMAFSLAVLLTYKETDSIDTDKVEMLSSVALKGQKSIITLTDGSKVYLNSGSSISYPKVFANGVREITLVGEAFFEVARDEQKPFIVNSGNVTTQVLGTSFNIQAFPNQEISVTVATGKVQVQTKEKNGKNNFASVILSPNQRVVYNPINESLITSEVSVERFTAWKSNIIYFEDTSIEDAAKLLEQWYNVSIEFENSQIKYCIINGQYKDQSLGNVLKSIQYMYNIEYEFITQNKIKFYGKGCKRK